jgi:hypothetical protein
MDDLGPIEERRSRVDLRALGREGLEEGSVGVCRVSIDIAVEVRQRDWRRGQAN